MYTLSTNNYGHDESNQKEKLLNKNDIDSNDHRSSDSQGTLIINQEILDLERQLATCRETIQNQEKKILNQEEKLHKYQKEVLDLREQLSIKEKQLISQAKQLVDQEKQLQMNTLSLNYQNEKLLMQQQQILNQDEKIDVLLSKIAALERNQVEKTKIYHAIIIVQFCIIVGCIMLIVRNML